MIHLDVTFANIRMIASTDIDGDFSVAIHDNLTGEETERTWSPDEFACVVAHTIMGDECPEHAAKTAWFACHSLPKHLRPIP